MQPRQDSNLGHLGASTGGMAVAAAAAVAQSGVPKRFRPLSHETFLLL